MLRPIFCIDLNTHSDRKWIFHKIMKNIFKKTIFVKYFTPVISSTQIACDVIWVPHVIFTWATKKPDFFYKEFFL